MAGKMGVTYDNSHDDAPGVTKGGVQGADPLPLAMNPPNVGNDPMLNHPHLEVSNFIYDNTAGA